MNLQMETSGIAVSESNGIVLTTGRPHIKNFYLNQSGALEKMFLAISSVLSTMEFFGWSN